MSRAWIERLGGPGREIVAHCLARHGMESQAALLRSHEVGRKAALHRDARSRQARHAQARRARSTSAATCIFEAYSDPKIADFAMSAEFAELHPVSGATQFSAMHLVPSLYGKISDVPHAFERAAALLLQLGSRTAVLPRRELLRVHGCIAVLYGAVLSGMDISDAWVDLYREATRKGLLENPHLRLQLAALGSWAGHWSAHLDWLVHPQSRDFELADTYLLVRDEASSQLLDRAAAAIRGERVDPTLYLAPGHAASTLRWALDYAMGCMRDPGHLSTGGHGLAVLTMVEDVQRHRALLERRGLLQPGAPQLDEALRRMSTVQYQEKKRFLALLDGLAPGAVKQRFTELWERDVVTDRVTRSAQLRWAEAGDPLL